MNTDLEILNKRLESESAVHEEGIERKWGVYPGRQNCFTIRESINVIQMTTRKNLNISREEKR
jgi:hypothetical protein